MARDYIPDSAENFLSWAKTLRDSLTALTLSSLSAARKQALLDRLERLIDPAQKVTDLRTRLTGAETALGDARARELTDLRKELGDLKHLEGLPAGVAEELGIVTHATAFDPNAYQPRLKATARRGFNELAAAKRGVDAMNYYWRRKGDTAWRPLALGRLTSPVRNETPLA